MRCRYYYRSVLQVTQESVSSTVCMSRKYAWIASFPGSPPPFLFSSGRGPRGEPGNEPANAWTHNEIEGSHDKIIITLLCCPWHCYLPSLVPRPPPFLPSVCVHNNTRERKTGVSSIFRFRVLLWTQTGDQNGGGLGPRLPRSQAFPSSSFWSLAVRKNGSLA